MDCEQFFLSQLDNIQTCCQANQIRDGSTVNGKVQGRVCHQETQGFCKANMAELGHGEEQDETVPLITEGARVL